MSTKTTADKNKYSQKLVACLQSTGRQGKSTFAECLINWLTFAEVELAAIDSDKEHRDLSNRHDNATFFDAVSNSDQFADFIERLPSCPVIIADFPAQSTTFLLENWEKFNVASIFQEKGIRFVNVIFASDDPTARVAAHRIFEQFGNTSDYLVVRNPAKFTSKIFEVSDLYKSIMATGAREIKIPTLTQNSLESVTKAAQAVGHFVTLEEASKAPTTSTLQRYELEWFRNQMLVQLEEAGDILLPSTDLIKNKVVKEAKDKKEAVNPVSRL